MYGPRSGAPYAVEVLRAQMTREVGATECSSSDIGHSQGSRLWTLVSVVLFQATVVAVDYWKSIGLGFIVCSSQIRPPYTGAAVVTMAESVTSLTVLSFACFAGAAGSHMSFMTASGAHHGGGTLGFVVVSDHTTFVAHYRFTFGSYVTPAVAICT